MWYGQNSSIGKVAKNSFFGINDLKWPQAASEVESEGILSKEVLKSLWDTVKIVQLEKLLKFDFWPQRPQMASEVRFEVIRSP